MIREPTFYSICDTMLAELEASGFLTVLYVINGSVLNRKLIPL